MTKKLRNKIMIVMMGLLSLTLIIILIAINMLNYNKITQEETTALENYLESKLQGPNPNKNKLPPNEFNENAIDTAPPNNSDQNTNTDASNDNAANLNNDTSNNNAAKPNNGSSNNNAANLNNDTSNDNAANQNNDTTFNKNNNIDPSQPLNNPQFPDENGQEPPVPPAFSNPDVPFENEPLAHSINQFSLIYVKCESNGNIITYDTNHSDLYTQEQLTDYCKQIIADSTKTGELEQLKYIKHQSHNDYDLVLLDLSSSRSNNRNLLIYSILLGIIGLFIFAAISYVISGFMIKPVETAFEQQKDFIAAASHELKTPLTVIQANSEILQDQYGDSKWLSYIQTECEQTNRLITSLLTLTKLEQNESFSQFATNFNASESLLERILPFESVAFEKGFTFTYEIAPNIILFGIKEQIQQVLGILLDNAFYHTSEHGSINIKLSKHTRNVQLIVSNTGKAIPIEEQEKLFQRFYRADKSRSRENGHFGLGLSIAKSIIDQHHGTIKIHCENGITSFIVGLNV